MTFIYDLIAPKLGSLCGFEISLDRKEEVRRNRERATSKMNEALHGPKRKLKNRRLVCGKKRHSRIAYRKMTYSLPPFIES